MRHIGKKVTAAFMSLVLAFTLPGAYVQAGERNGAESDKTSGKSVVDGIQGIEKTAKASVATEDGWTYIVSDGEAKAARYTGSDTAVEIPGTLGGYPVTSLDHYLFYGCDKVESIRIPASVKKIEVLAFEYGDSLSEITVAEENTAFSAEDGVLFNRDKTQLLHYPKAKEGTSYTVPDTVITIGQFAFDACEGLTDIVVADSVTTIGNQAIYDCDSLENVTLSAALEKLECWCMYDCDRLTSIHIPEKVREIGTLNPFLWGCPIETVTVDDRNPYFTAVDNVVFSKDMTRLVCYPVEKKESSYTVPDTVQSLSRFSGNKYLQRVDLPEGLKVFEMGAFQSCSSLSEVNFPSTLTTINAEVFLGTGLETDIVLPESVNYIGWEAFYGGIPKLTVMNPSCRIYDDPEVFGKQTVLCGYENSSIYKYAKNYGCVFENLETGDRTEFVVDNTALVSLLPTENVNFGEPTWHAGECTIIHESDTNREEYLELKGVTEDLIKNCSTDYEKVVTISNWVSDRMTYVFGHIAGNSIEAVYNIYRNPSGNCMRYRLLAAYMLYLAGFSTVDVTSADHEWCLVWVDGGWLTVDPTNRRVGTAWNDCDDILKMSFSMNGMSYTVSKAEGIYLQCISYTLADCQNVTEIMIPDFVEGVDSYAFYQASANLVVHGMKGTYAEEYMREKYNCIAYDGDDFVAKKEHQLKEATLEDGEAGFVCENCLRTLKSLEGAKAMFTKIGELPATSAEYRKYISVWGGDRELTEGKDYTLQISGTSTDTEGVLTAAAVVISGAGDYTGKFSYRLVPIRQIPVIYSVKREETGGITLEWSREAGAAGYVIYRKTGDGAYELVQNVEDRDIGKWTDTETDVSQENSYYIQSYTRDGTETVYSSPSECAMIADISKAAVKLSADSYVYDGKSKKPSAEVTLGDTVLREGTDYMLSYRNNINAGTAVITVTGKGSYTGEISKSFTIEKAEQVMSTGISSTDIEVATLINTSVAGKGTLSYRSDNPGVASVDEEGYVRSISAGTATITVTAAGNENYKPGVLYIRITVRGRASDTDENGESDRKTEGTETGGTGSGSGAEKEVPKAGTKLLDGYVIYKVTKAGSTVQYVKTAARGKNVAIPAQVTVNGITYKVTSIAANAFKNDSTMTKVTIGKNVASIGKKAFYGCKKLKNITIKTAKLTAKTVGKQAFKGIYAKAKIKVPKNRKKAYQTMLKKRGVTAKAKIK